MTNQTEFLKRELKKKGYPLENYLQALLANKGWHVQPNAYFLDKDTNKGRELDIRAIYDDFEYSSWSYFPLNLLIQCRRIEGNAWIFFSVPQRSTLLTKISRYGLPEFLESAGLVIFGMGETHFEKSEVLATNYCEIITDKKKSNKRTDNIWNCVITLIKATSQELEQAHAETKRYLEEEGGFSDFAENPIELVNIFYPLIVFEGKMYEAKFFNNDIELERREYVQLFVDYQSGRYKGEFCIDVITKERFSEYLKEVLDDLAVFDKRRVEKSKEYEKMITEAFKTSKREFFARKKKTNITVA